MAKLLPFIRSEDARAQAAFYTQALGGEILSVVTGDQVPNADPTMKNAVVHLSLVAGGIPFYMSECGREPLKRGNEITLSLEFATEAEARAAFDKLAQGGEVQQPLEPAFWGALFGELTDKWGIHWTISSESNAGRS